MSPSQDRRVAGLRRGDAAAFDAVYEAFRPRLYGFLVRLTGQVALSEDLLQETFLRLARAGPRLAPDTRLAAWLFTVARNLFISHRRWAMLDLARLSELRLLVDAARQPPSPFAAVAASETERRLEEAVARLPLPYREVLLLCVLERLAPSEAAAVLELPATTVRKRLSRARAMIRRTLCEADAGERLPAAADGDDGSRADER